MSTGETLDLTSPDVTEEQRPAEQPSLITDESPADNKTVRVARMPPRLRKEAGVSASQTQVRLPESWADMVDSDVEEESTGACRGGKPLILGQRIRVTAVDDNKRGRGPD